MNSDERIYQALNSISALTNNVFFTYIPEDMLESLKEVSSALVILSGSDVVSTLSGPVSVRADYIVDFRAETSGDCQDYLNQMLTNLSDSISNYTIIDVGRDTALQRTVMRVSLTIGN